MQKSKKQQPTNMLCLTSNLKGSDSAEDSAASQNLTLKKGHLKQNGKCYLDPIELKVVTKFSTKFGTINYKVTSNVASGGKGNNGL